MITIHDYILRHGVKPTNIGHKKGVIYCPVCFKHPSEGGYSLSIQIRPCTFCRLGIEVQNKEAQEIRTAVAVKDTKKLRNLRVKYWKSLCQPFRRGKPSLEFKEFYPDIAKKTFTRYQWRNAKYVWKDLPGWEDRHNSE